MQLKKRKKRRRLLLTLQINRTEKTSRNNSRSNRDVKWPPHTNTHSQGLVPRVFSLLYRDHVTNTWLSISREQINKEISSILKRCGEIPHKNESEITPWFHEHTFNYLLISRLISNAYKTRDFASLEVAHFSANYHRRYVSYPNSSEQKAWKLQAWTGLEP